ncbi:hypothetical protein [Micromonospora sp. NPDC005652]|uniref:hypothetical protein n=1 Tax=Micromonospora sp. NPDC005652 TaxID=3157046 RepID=UPI0034032C1B
MTAAEGAEPASESDVLDGLARYFAIREQQRRDEVARALATLRPYERRIVREAAVMGYVRGAMAGRARATMGEPRDGDIPSDSAILQDVISACISMDYPYLQEAAYGRRRRVTKVRRWPGEDGGTTRGA